MTQLANTNHRRRHVTASRGPAMSGLPSSPDADDPLGHILATGAVRSVYQPIVDLRSGAAVGYEALARGPKGSDLERPDVLFALARETGRLAELDTACQLAAVTGAQEAGLVDPWTLFVNIEPGAAHDAFRLLPSADGPSDGPQLRIIVELTERALTANPTQLLELVGRVRARGWGIALDDVGADRNSLALLPLLRPDVIKLDLRLIQARPSGDIAEIVSAVNAEAERSGAVVLAEGIEDDGHVDVAFALGATLGQGWMFGRPAELPAELPEPADRVVITPHAQPATNDSPFALGSAVSAPRSTRKALLIEISKHLERQAMRAGEATVVLATFQEAEFFTPLTRRRYTDLARTTAFVGALGQGMPSEPMPGVRGGQLADDDPVVGEWDIAVVGPHFAATLLARDLGDDGPDSRRRFEYVLSHDRDLAIAVATSLISRVSPEAGSAAAAASQRPSPAVVTDPDGASALTAVPGLLERAVNSTRTGIAIADAQRPDMPLIYVNPGFEALTGFRAAQALGRNCRFLQGEGTDSSAVSRMAAALARHEPWATRLLNYRANGTPFWNQLELHPVHDTSGQLTHYISIQDDVSARVEAEQRVSYLAYHDHLTGLPNRTQFVEKTDHALHRAQQQGTTTAMLFIDLDDFKRVNDGYGHMVGDSLLCRVSDTLRTAIRDGDVLARQGGDEFLLLMTDLDPALAATTANEVAARIHAALERPIELTEPGGQTVHVRLGASIGTSLAPAGATKVRELIQGADAAMYEAKRSR